MLEIENLVVRYGAVTAIQDVSLSVLEGELVALLGSNGAGKTTLLRAASGLVRSVSGSIRLDGHEMNAAPPERIARSGLAHVPEGRRIFGSLTVEQNLLLGAAQLPRKTNLSKDFDRIYDLFPILAERRRQFGWSLSGGQQQMLAIGRGLMSRPRLLMLDEPSLGLAPILVRQVLSAVRSVCDSGTAVLLVEQNARAALKIADRGVVLSLGSLAQQGPSSELAADPHMRKTYLGV